MSLLSANRFFNRNFLGFARVEFVTRLFGLAEKLQGAHDLERAIHGLAHSSSGAEIRSIREAAKPFVEPIVSSLKSRGLIVADAQAAEPS